ncbi:MAG: protease modulator HflC [Chromatiales bacterium]
MLSPKFLIAAVIALIIGWASIFVITERDQAIVLYLGRIHRSDYEPGLHFKLPILMQVRKFDRRLLNLDAEAERFLTKEKKDVIVDSYVRWRIANLEKYYRATRGDERLAAQLLYQTINSRLREEFGRRTVQEVVSGQRGAIMTIVTKAADESGQDLGVKVMDVRIKRIDLPAEVSSSVYGRMRAERERTARDFRSRGAEAAERIRAGADKERTVIVAEAYRDAETARGQGDARAAAIYAGAFSADREFYDFYRSLNAYRSAFKSRNDILVLQPDSKFFDYFNSPQGPTPSP